MLGLTGIFRGAGRRRAGELYARIVGQARQRAFYTDFCVPDTIEGRLELITLHCHAVLRRMHAIGATAESAARDLLEYMFDDLDRSIREVGVGDVSVGKYMKRLGKGFYGRAEAYDRALDAGDTAMLAGALRRNVLATSEASDAEIDGAAAALARYTASLTSWLERYDLAGLQTYLSFPELNLSHEGEGIMEA